jgi:hypothetical protein
MIILQNSFNLEGILDNIIYIYHYAGKLPGVFETEH